MELPAQFVRGLRDDQRVDRRVAHFAAYDQFEAVREQRPHHCQHLGDRRVPLGLRHDVPPLGTHPIRAADQLKILQLIRVEDHAAQRFVRKRHTAARLDATARAFVAGSVSLDRGDIKRRSLGVQQQPRIARHRGA
jgi:hypothetical protein